MEHKWTIFCNGFQLQFLKLALDSPLHSRSCIYFCFPWSLVDVKIDAVFVCSALVCLSLTNGFQSWIQYVELTSSKCFLWCFHLTFLPFHSQQNCLGKAWRWSGLKGRRKRESFPFTSLPIPSVLSPSSLSCLLSEKSLSWFLLKGPVVGSIFVTAGQILLMARKEISCCGRRLCFPSIANCSLQRRGKNFLPFLCTCAFF